MRTFLCIPIDVSLREELAELSSQLRQLVRVRASWVRPENFHLTVRFLGEIDPMLTVELDRLFRPITERIAPFDLAIDQLGAFPSPQRARVLWAGGEAPSPFLELVTSLNRALARIGFPEERKATVSHITLARIKGRADQSIEEAIRALDGWRGGRLRADQLILMESRLTPSGAVYTSLFTLPLGSSTAGGDGRNDAI